MTKLGSLLVLSFAVGSLGGCAAIDAEVVDARSPPRAEPGRVVIVDVVGQPKGDGESLVFESNADLEAFGRRVAANAPSGEDWYFADDAPAHLEDTARHVEVTFIGEQLNWGQFWLNFLIHWPIMFFGIGFPPLLVLELFIPSFGQWDAEFGVQVDGQRRRRTVPATMAYTGGTGSMASRNLFGRPDPEDDPMVDAYAQAVSAEIQHDLKRTSPPRRVDPGRSDPAEKPRVSARKRRPPPEIERSDETEDEPAAAPARMVRLAVLEFRPFAKKIPPSMLYRLSDAARSGVLQKIDTSRNLLMTRETMETLVAEMGGCEMDAGNCELDAIRSIGADYGMTGELHRVEGYYIVTLKLFAAKSGALLAAEEVRAKKRLDLTDKVEAAAAELISKVPAEDRR